MLERLFVTKFYNEEGVYRVKLCKNGEWTTVTIDDYFPCYPDGGPIFTTCTNNDLWILILEKAYAKLHGTYLALRGGYSSEGIQDLTGSPTIYYDLQNEVVNKAV